MFYYILGGALFLVFVVYLIFLFIFYKSSSESEMISSYECGYDIISSTRLVFSYRFFLMSVLFIIFDVEISLILPSPFLVEGIISIFFFFFFFWCLGYYMSMFMVL